MSNDKDNFSMADLATGNVNSFSVFVRVTLYVKICIDLLLSLFVALNDEDRAGLVNALKVSNSTDPI